MLTPTFASIALDLGTTSIKAGLLDDQGLLCNIIVQPAPVMLGQGGRYECDALAYVGAVERALDGCLTLCGGKRPPLGLSSQRSSFLLWDRSSGQPITPLISWQDNRGAPSCAALTQQANLIHELTGLRLTPYYLAPKLCVVLHEHPEWHERLLCEELLVGTLDTFIIWRWSGGRYHVTDSSMAARTLLMDIRQVQWSSFLCALFNIPLAVLPQIRSSTGMDLLLSNGLRLKSSLADQSAAFIASVGEEKATATVLVNLGTGGFVMRSMDADKDISGGYLRSLIYQDEKLRTHIAVEGTLNSIATALAPYPVEACVMADLAGQDIFCLAEPSGMGAPYFRDDLGIRYSHSIEHLTRPQIAALLLEAVIFRVVRILDEFHHNSAIERVYLSGGLSELACLQHGIARCAPMKVYRLLQKESSLRGAALLAAGISPSHCTEAIQVEVGSDAGVLTEKYRLWNNWLDKLLGS